MDKKNKEWPTEVKNAVWRKAPYIDNRHPEYGKFDPCKACIKEEYYGNQDSEYGWQIDHIFPEQVLKDAGVPQEIIDHIDNLRPMHCKNNNKKSDNFPKYPGVISAIGYRNFDISRDYQVNRDQINILRHLFCDYINIPQPTVLGRWQAMVDRSIVPTYRVPAIFLDDIVTPSIHDLD